MEQAGEQNDSSKGYHSFFSREKLSQLISIWLMITRRKEEYKDWNGFKQARKYLKAWWVSIQVLFFPYQHEFGTLTFFFLGVIRSKKKTLKVAKETSFPFVTVFQSVAICSPAGVSRAACSLGDMGDDVMRRRFGNGYFFSGSVLVTKLGCICRWSTENRSGRNLNRLSQSGRRTQMSQSGRNQVWLSALDQPTLYKPHCRDGWRWLNRLWNSVCFWNCWFGNQCTTPQNPQTSRIGPLHSHSFNRHNQIHPARGSR